MGQWTPARVLGSGQTGAYFDITDPTTMTQDSAGTTAAAVDQPVGRWVSKYNGHVASQSTSAARPTLRRGTGLYNELDGTDDLWTIGSSASSMKFLHSTPSVVIAGARFGDASNPDAVYGLLGSSGATNANTGAAYFFDDRSSVPRNNALAALTSNSSGSPVISTASVDYITPNVDHVVTFIADPANATAASRMRTRVDGVELAVNAGSQTPSTSNSTYDVDLGALGNAVAPMKGRLYSILILGYMPSMYDIQKAEAFIGRQCGVYL